MAVCKPGALEKEWSQRPLSCKRQGKPGSKNDTDAEVATARNQGLLTSTSQMQSVGRD